ncbi:MAG TPA: uridine kinase [Firmicutes bacterium]|nr:uridine kinase [Bacillota bacterium]
MGNRVHFIGIAGGTGAGKTTLAGKLLAALGEEAGLLHLDHYFRPGTPTHNRPEAIDCGKLLADMDRLQAGICVEVKNRVGELYTIEPRPLIFIEGHLLLCFPEVRERLDLAVYIDLDSDERVVRRICRNVERFGMPLAQVAAWYLSDAKEGHDRFIEPTRRYADLIIWGDLKERSINALLAAVKALQS